MSVQPSDISALLPLAIVAATVVVLMLAIAVRRSHLLAVALTLAGLSLAWLSLLRAASVAPHAVTALLIVDRYALFYMGLILAAGAAVAIMAQGYLAKLGEEREELYALLLLATLGAQVLVASNHLASFFLGLELLSVSLYAMTAFLRTRPLAVEAGVKYLVLAASSTAFLLFGMALIYAECGTLSLEGIARAMAGTPNVKATLFLPGLALLIPGIGFKLGVVPFHLWTPDVYEGAPAPVTAFLATVSKGGVFALLLRYFLPLTSSETAGLTMVFGLIAILSMIGGNLLGLLQDNVKRILAYSSIAHLGYLLVAFLAGGSRAAEAVSFYLVAYFVTTLGAFGVITLCSDEKRDADRLDDYRGLFWRRPALALIFTAMLLSLAGIPLTAGFVGKFYVLLAGMATGLWALALVLILSSVIGLFYYLRIVVALFAQPERLSAEGAPLTARVSVLGRTLLAVLTALLLWWGLYPAQIVDLIRTVANNAT